MICNEYLNEKHFIFEFEFDYDLKWCEHLVKQVKKTFII